MSLYSVGDMSQIHQLRRHSSELKSHATRLADEMTTGAKADTGAAVRGDFTALAGVERALASLGSFAIVTAEATQFAATQQVALGTVATLLGEAGPMLLSASTSTNPAVIAAATGDAAQKFATIIAALNTNTAGRYSFAGTASDTRPLAPAEDILAALGAATAGETTVSGYIAALEAWFDAPAGNGGYLDAAYDGGASLAPFPIASGERVEIATTAAAPEVRDLLKGMALGAMISQGAMADDVSARAALTRAAGDMTMSAAGAATALAARVGSIEAQIDDCATRNSAETAALGIARTAMTAADPYDTATALEAVQAQIETLYTLTARLSALKLTDYLR